MYWKSTSIECKISDGFFSCTLFVHTIYPNDVDAAVKQNQFNNSYECDIYFVPSEVTYLNVYIVD